MNEQQPSTGARPEPHSALGHAERSAAESKHLSGGGVADLIERAFHYRGDVTVQTDDGASTTGYLFNRNARAPEPFAQLFEAGTGREVSLPYRSVTGVLFTGRDTATASVRRFEAFQDRHRERDGD